MMDAASALAIIERLAGPATFERGQALFNDQAILSYAKNRNTITSKVQSASSLGGKHYNVELTVNPKSYDGGCDCPASEGFDFCKHCVAVALHHADKLKQLENAQGGSAVDVIAAYIENIGEIEAKQALLKLIATDEEQLTKWQLLAQITSEFGVINEDGHRSVVNIPVPVSRSGKKASVMTPLKAMITKALPSRDVWQYNKVRAYFQQAQQKLSTLFELLPHLPSEQAHALSYQIIKRYDGIIERVDDSGGFRFVLEREIEDAFARCVQRLEWPAQTKAQYLLQLYTPELDVHEFKNIPERFLVSASSEYDDAVREAFYQGLAESVMRNDLPDDVIQEQLQHLCAYYESQGEYEQAIYISASLAKHPQDYLALVKWALALGDAQRATEFLKQAKQVDTMSRWTAECLQLEVQIAQLNATPDTAIELQWHAYMHSLVLDDYIQMNVLIEQTVKKSQLTATKAKWLEITLVQLEAKMAEKKLTGDALVELCLYSGELEKAMQHAKTFPIDRELLHQVAKVSVKQAPERCFEFYERLIKIWVKSAKAADYKRVINLMMECKDILHFLPKRIKAEAKFEFLINEIAYDYARKRQLQSMIKKHFVV